MNADIAGQVGRIQAIAAKLAGLRDELRNYSRTVDDLRPRAMLETGAEVFSGQRQPFVDYTAGTEQAWKR